MRQGVLLALAARGAKVEWLGQELDSSPWLGPPADPPGDPGANVGVSSVPFQFIYSGNCSVAQMYVIGAEVELAPTGGRAPAAPAAGAKLGPVHVVVMKALPSFAADKQQEFAVVQRSAPIELEYNSPRPREFLVFPKEDALPVAPGECLGWAVSEKSNAMITHDNLGPSNPELIWHGEDYLWAATGNPYLGRMSDVRRFRA